MSDAARQAAGVAITEQILQAVAPIVDGLPSDLAIEALSGAMMATVLIGCPDPADRATVLRRYAKRINAIATELIALQQREGRG